MTDEPLPRRFGPYLLTAFLQEDALGRVYRARRLTGDTGFARLRILEGPEISEDAVLDSIEENGEIHTFLKNTAISRGVVLDSADGIPYLAWSEDSGRTLDTVMEKARREHQAIPYEHALLIVEKVSTALDHAYNTTIEGERTLHGLVWPGFVSLSDDGEIRLTGFGLASGFLPSAGRPRFAREIAPYLAPEERAQGRIEKNSDVYSLGALLFEMLVGKAPSPSDPAGDLRTALRDGAPIAPEVSAVLRLCLGPPEARFQSMGELRRELGKLLFSGPYSPSTFNLAFFLNGLFSPEMEAETKARTAEGALDSRGEGAAPAPVPPPRVTPAPALRPASPSAAPVLVRSAASRAPAPIEPRPAPRRRPPFVLGGALLVTAAVGGTVFMVLRRPQSAVRVAAVPILPTERPATPTALPVAVTGPTTRMTDAEFKDEVARRVSQELRKIDQEMRKRTPPDVANAAAALKARPPAPVVTIPARLEPPASDAVEAPPSPVKVAVAPPSEPSPAPESESAAPAPTSPAPAAPAAAAPVVEVAPKISRVIKPLYPQVALRAHIGGIVLLRVLVSETGEPVEVQVLKGVAGGLTESAVAAVRHWRFQPATRGGSPVRGWTTIPIPFEP
ncbi:MAG: TonB family protein [Acidobacteriota bacterium]|nr:TonB family protein [Acidobacteriota bacterium]